MRRACITVEFDANTQGPWSFRPSSGHVTVHPGEMVTVLYQFRNDQPGPMAARPFRATRRNRNMPPLQQAQSGLFPIQYELKARRKQDVAGDFVVDPGLPKDVSSITLSYTFFRGGRRTPAAPKARWGEGAKTAPGRMNDKLEKPMGPMRQLAGSRTPSAAKAVAGDDESRGVVLHRDPRAAAMTRMSRSSNPVPIIAGILVA